MREKALATTNYVAIASTLQEIQNDVATQMIMPPQETIVKSLNTYKRKFANALPHIPHGKDFQIPEQFKDFVAFDKGKDEPERPKNLHSRYYQIISFLRSIAHLQ